jgi:hypothetical protein
MRRLEPFYLLVIVDENEYSDNEINRAGGAAMRKTWKTAGGFGRRS